MTCRRVGMNLRPFSKRDFSYMSREIDVKLTVLSPNLGITSVAFKVFATDESCPVALPAN